MASEIVHTLFSLVARTTLWISFFIFESQLPFIRHIDEEEIWYYRYPSVEVVLPQYVLWAFLIVHPLLILLFQFCFDNDLTDVLTTIRGISMALPINGLITSILKVSVGRPRPNFFARCFPDGYGTNFDNCTGDYNDYIDARKSFPSSHASFAFAEFMYLSLHLFKTLKVKESHGAKGWKLCLCIYPLVLAIVIGISRTCDYSHHYSDVIFGAILGTSVACVVFWVYSAN